MRAVLLALAVAALTPMGWAQSSPVFQADFSNPGLTPSHWTMTLYPDGSGHFRADSGVPGSGFKAEKDPPLVDRDIRVNAQFAARVFLIAQRHKLFSNPCESHMKVAFEGWKRLSYSGPDGEGACEFNYSKDAEIQALGDSLVSVAATINEGARLESLLQHDRLGLDKEMEYIVEAAGAGRLQQICAIRGILQRLAEDESVLDRVRTRARMLLATEGD
jgi:hypothetical protein